MTNNLWWQEIWNQPLPSPGLGSVWPIGVSMGEQGKGLLMRVMRSWPWISGFHGQHISLSAFTCLVRVEGKVEPKRCNCCPPYWLLRQIKEKHSPSSLPSFLFLEMCWDTRWVVGKMWIMKSLTRSWRVSHGQRPPPLRSHLDDIPASFTLLAAIVSLQRQAIHFSQADHLTRDNSYESTDNI